MQELIRPVISEDWPAITGIFNHFIVESFAAYSDQPVPENFFPDRYRSQAAYPFLVAERDGRVVGFAYLAPFHPAPTMKHAANLTYFIHPDFTGQGLGGRFMELLFAEGQKMGITNFLANISSLNPGSLHFHRNHGFTECGRMLGVGVKMGESFDMVWVQKRITQL